MSLLRKALEDGAHGLGYRRGYRFSAPVNEVAPAAAPATAEGVGRARLYALAAGVAALGPAALLLRDRGRSPMPPAGRQRASAFSCRSNIEEGKEPTISSDGRALAMTATADGMGRLMIRRLDSPSSTPAPALENSWLPIFSPEGRLSY